MEKWTIEQIEKKLFAEEFIEEDFLHSLRNDGRKGVQRILVKWEKQEQLKKQLHEHFISMTAFEKQYSLEGYKYIAGIDEAGRGPLAGPVVAGAVILPEDFYLPGLNDSKKIPEVKREEYYDVIMEKALAAEVGIISSEEIDAINILQATKKAMLVAISRLSVSPDFLLVDAVKLDTPYPSEALIKGDARSISIAAASIIAKVTRDRIMKEISLEYPQYGFDANMGYGTAEHLKAINEYGVTPYHRKTFAPIKENVEQ
jgi:ribonuclease HII